jgi:hypothetical protein
MRKIFNNVDELVDFCHKKYMRDLSWRENAFWYDQICDDNNLLIPRLCAYEGALFILSNVSRYEPEYLDLVLRPTDIAFAVNSFLDTAERCIPLMIIEMLNGPTYFQ